MDLGGSYSSKNTQVRALEELLRKLPSPEIAETPSSRRSHPGLPRRIRKLDVQQERELITAYRSGDTIYELADRFGIDRKTASRVLHRHNVPMRRRGLSSTQVDEAMRLHEAGWTAKEIGDHFGVSPRTVSGRLREHRAITPEDHHDGDPHEFPPPTRVPS